ncbi:hypothetical protein OG589_22650 [Sphaerisporangium sp. NBC_01403]|uniref:hypothetical protein n=1 Tax=Sphaerisporangium sp. NBC_01403 TaxID=2903599 RepID=UPI0032549B58
MTTTTEPAEDTYAVYQVHLPLSSKAVNFVADLLRGHIKTIGSRWRKKNWRILTKVRMNPIHATQLLRALMVLTRCEITR